MAFWNGRSHVYSSRLGYYINCGRMSFVSQSKKFDAISRTMSLIQGAPPKISWQTTRHYFATRISTLKPPLNWPPNPITQLQGMTTLNWLLYVSGYVRFVPKFRLTASLPGHGTASIF